MHKDFKLVKVETVKYGTGYECLKGSVIQVDTEDSTFYFWGDFKIAKDDCHVISTKKSAEPYFAHKTSGEL